MVGDMPRWEQRTDNGSSPTSSGEDTHDICKKKVLSQSVTQNMARSLLSPIVPTTDTASLLSTNVSRTHAQHDE
jgi:hypothetical protein